ncbi:DUF2147 domain-containing protein [Sphingomonas sp. GB1N7]|uniref:DUF2147 domain-containing protein n=1 Tax=Parasphingomonas caseinilytica TaxID=3096158 RepID=UPI002FCB9A0E
MKAFVAFAGAALAAAPAVAAPAHIAGRWLTQGGKAVVEIAPCGPHLCGRIVRLVKIDPSKPKTDVNNPDKAQRARPILGIAILSAFTPADDRWKGQIYDPESGRTYRSELRREGDALKVKGCFGPFCRTQDWTKAG